jgi:aspartyl-tRNA(Asn)/glutamyl-tRNA(Gln) amidotransferase subunit A
MKIGRLAGMVIGIKDNICYKNHKVSASSKILAGYVSPYSSTVVERLLSEDAVIIGRLNCDEFAMGSSNENSAFGPVLNPYDNTRVSGGSSGGSVAAVATNLCLAALGSDTGGSIRQPAAFCGLTGLKPTYGRVSRYGLIAYASSFDQIGTITHTAEDAARILEVIAGPDGLDATLSSEPVPEYSVGLKNSGKKYNIAYISQLLENESIIPEIRSLYRHTLDKLRQSGHSIHPVDFDYFDYLVPAYYVLTTAEASSNLARFDGVRYGYRADNPQDLDDLYKKSRSIGFGHEVKRRIMLGTFVLSSGYYDAYYSKAQKVRRIITDATDNILKSNDYLFLPTTPDVAFRFGENSDDPIKMYLQDIFTVQANLTGHPAISYRCGYANNGMPAGMQIIGRKFDEAGILALADSLQV